jgi:CheY-like chemotaxis protein
MIVAAESITGVATVLVVEDEAILRMLNAEMLEDAGFRVLEAGSADEAVNILERSPDVRVMFSDVKMPGTMDGIDLARLVHDRWPNIGILLTSGHIRPNREDLPNDGRFVAKPYVVNSVISEINRLIQTH